MLLQLVVMQKELTGDSKWAIMGMAELQACGHCVNRLGMVIFVHISYLGYISFFPFS